MGGGGMSGTTEFPTITKHMLDEYVFGNSLDATDLGGDRYGDAGEDLWSYHTLTRPEGLMYWLATALDADPYGSSKAYDPNSALTLIANSPMKRAHDAWSTLSDVAGGLTDTAGAATSLAGAMDVPIVLIQKVLDEMASGGDLYTQMENEVTEFTTRLNADRQRGIGTFAGGMADINATMSSAFVTGMAMLEMDKQHEVNRFRQEVRARYFGNFIQVFLQSLAVGAQSASVVAQLGVQLNTQFTDLLNREQIRDDEFDHLDAMWETEIYLRCIQSLSMSAGAQYIPKKPSVKSQVISGVLGGVSMLAGTEAGASAIAGLL